MAARYDNTIAALCSSAEFGHYFLHEKLWRFRPIALPDQEQIDQASAVLDGRFTYIGESYRLDLARPWKDNPSRDKEWLIAHHKHYFAFDLAQAFSATGDQAYLAVFSALLSSWLDEMGTGYIAASDAQVEAKRVESWIMALIVIRRAPHRKTLPDGLVARLVTRIYEEAHYIAGNLRPGRNHRTFQLFALALAGLLIEEIEGHKGLANIGVEGLTANLLADFLSCGVHVERSTHYHNITLETALEFVDLARRNEVMLDPALLPRLEHALDFAAATQLPDGDMLLLNESDAADHRDMFRRAAELFAAPRFEWIASRGRSGAPPPWKSREFCGYVIMRDGWGDCPQQYAGRQHVFFDCAPLGEGSHSHYDLLNVCWFAGNQPIIVDPGRYTYNAEPDGSGIDWRREFKSTRFHNTIEIDGRDQTKYLSKAKRTPPGVERYDRRIHGAKHGPEVEINNYRYSIGQHDDWAYATARSSEYSPLHSRAVMFMRRQYVVVLDIVESFDENEHSATLRYHFASSWRDRLSVQTKQATAIIAPLGLQPPWQLHVIGPSAATSTLDEGWVSRTYGLKEKAPVFKCEHRGVGRLSFASVLLPAETDAGRIYCRGVSNFATEDGSTGVAVMLEIAGAIMQDDIIFSAKGSSPCDPSISGGSRLFSRRSFI